MLRYVGVNLLSWISFWFRLDGAQVGQRVINIYVHTLASFTYFLWLNLINKSLVSTWVFIHVGWWLIFQIKESAQIIHSINISISTGSVLLSGVKITITPTLVLVSKFGGGEEDLVGPRHIRVWFLFHDLAVEVGEEFFVLYFEGDISHGYLFAFFSIVSNSFLRESEWPIFSIVIGIRYSKHLILSVFVDNLLKRHPLCKHLCKGFKMVGHAERLKNL